MIDPTFPKVSVSILTYNQEDLIGQAIESVLMQQTDFPVEIRIGDDFSTDGTRAILEAYRSRHPDRIFLNLQPERPVGIAGRVNNTTNLASCRGRYIAMLDGDDYWTDPHKLQRQVDLLDADPALGGVAHDAAVVIDPGPAGPRSEPTMLFSHRIGEIHAPKAQVTIEDVLLLPPFQTSTFVFVADAIRPFPAWFDTIPAGDWGIFAIVAARGPIRVLPEPMSVYRVHDRSVVSGLWRSDRATRNHWHHSSMRMVAEAFPDARRTRRWKAIDHRFRFGFALDRRHYAGMVAAMIGFGLADPRVVRAVIRDPALYFAWVRRKLRGDHPA